MPQPKQSRSPQTPKTLPTLELEQKYTGTIIGVDEVGRGPWAGPVVAAAVCLDQKNIPHGINDSKKLSEAKREIIYTQLLETAHCGVGMASVDEIDQHNILGATIIAMQRAVECLLIKPDVALVDGNRAPELPCETHTVVKGDSISLSIAAASIIAKVTRDRIMADLAKEHPGYGWETNSGYGTKHHIAGLATQGITPHHRKSFAPIRSLLVELA